MRPAARADCGTRYEGMKAEQTQVVKHFDMSADPRIAFILSRIPFAIATHINADIARTAASPSGNRNESRLSLKRDSEQQLRSSPEALTSDEDRAAERRATFLTLT